MNKLFQTKIIFLFIILIILKKLVCKEFYNCIKGNIENQIDIYNSFDDDFFIRIINHDLKNSNNYSLFISLDIKQTFLKNEKLFILLNPKIKTFNNTNFIYENIFKLNISLKNNNEKDINDFINYDNVSSLFSENIIINDINYLNDFEKNYYKTLLLGFTLKKLFNFNFNFILILIFNFFF